MAVRSVQSTQVKGSQSGYLSKRNRANCERTASHIVAFRRMVKPKIGQRIVAVRRMAKYFARTAVVASGYIGGITAKPRDLYIPSGNIVMALGLFMASSNMVLVGAVLFSMVLLFQIVTLPVEFDATRRAKQLVVAQGIVSPHEREGVDKVLNAAALTYVAAAVSTLLTLLYFLMRAGFLGGSDD